MKNLLAVSVLLFVTILFSSCNAPNAPASGTSATLPNGDTVTVTGPKVDPPVQFVDRQGNPYANMPVVLVDSSTNTNTDYTTDSNGVVEYPKVEQGTVISLVQSSAVNSSENEYAAFTGTAPAVTIDGSKTTYQIVLERVAYTETNGDDVKATSQIALTSTVPGIAQAFTAATSETICSVGIGAYAKAGNPTGTILGIYTDHSGAPDSLVVYSTLVSQGYATDTQDGNQGSMADFCADGPGVSVTAGTVYWVVLLFPGSFDSQGPALVTLSVLNSLPKTGVTLSRANSGWSDAFQNSTAIDLWTTH
jgi:hypothetical protein